MKDNYIFTYDRLYIQDKKFSDILILNLQKESDNKSFIENKQLRELYKEGRINRNTLNSKLEYLNLFQEYCNFLTNIVFIIFPSC